MTDFLCPVCDFRGQRLTSLTRHCSYKHGISPKELYTQIHFSGVPPTCACGCGEKTRFVSMKDGFKEYVGQHKRAVRKKPARKRKVTPKFKCPLCDYKSTQGRLELHIHDIHKEDAQEVYIEHILGGDEKKAECECGCGNRSRWIGWKEGFSGGFLRGHNAKVDDPEVAGSFKQKEVQRAMADKRKQGYRSGKYDVWNKGLSNETDSRVRRMHEKASQTLKRKYNSGEIVPWQYRNPEAWEEICSKMSKDRRLSPSEIHQRIEGAPLDIALLSDLKGYEKRQTTLLQFRCEVCGEVWEKTLKNLEDTPRCFSCDPVASYDEITIRDFVSDLVGAENTRSGDRKLISPKELDIYVPIKKFAIEYNGLTFHTVDDIPKDYHQQKTELCREKGVTLFHIFGDEWRGPKRAIVESMIRSRLGANEKRVYARKCTIESIPAKVRRLFFKETHLDGDVKSTIAWALKDEQGRIVSALSLRKPFHKKYRGMWEVARFSSVLNTTVPGALGKLIKEAKTWAHDQGSKGLISYVDTRLGTGQSYECVGFEHLKDTDLRFWWTDGTSRFNRFKFRADSSRGMSEREVAQEAGVARIYGCKNRVLSLVF